VHLRVVPTGLPVQLLLEPEPAHTLELPGIGKQRRIALGAQDEPEVHVEVAVRAVGRRDRQEERLPAAEGGMEFRRDAEFLTRLADDGLERVLALFDVTAGRQPQAGLAVIPEQQAAAGHVDGDEVDHQVLRRRGGRSRPEERLPGRYPGENVRLVGGFPRVARADCRHEFRDKRANIVPRHPASVTPRNPLPAAAGKR
jgi:hypothetical protein